MTKFTVPVDGNMVVDAEDKQEALEKAANMMQYNDAGLVAYSKDLVKEVL